MLGLWGLGRGGGGEWGFLNEIISSGEGKGVVMRGSGDEG